MSAAVHLVPEAHSPRERATLQKFGGAECLPSGFRAALAEDKSLRKLAEEWKVSPTTAAHWRRKLYPEHPRNGRRGRPRRSTSRPVSRPRAVQFRNFDGLTPRQAEVLTRPVGAGTLAQLVRERPGGAPDICIICWRDIGRNYSAFAERLACARYKEGSQVRICQLYVRRCEFAAQEAQERTQQLSVEGWAS